jgi:transcription initiation factor TFIIIB Brf1 subunit/transcription initiation factor TFIIB
MYFIFGQVSLSVFNLDISFQPLNLVETLNRRCLECNGILIQTESDIVCVNCGLVANQIFEKPTVQLIKAENSFGSQYASISERPSSMKTLGTYVGSYRKHFFSDAKGTHLKIPAKRQFRRLKSLNDIYLHFNGRQREYRGYNFLARVCSHLQITEIAKADALFLFQKVHFHLKNQLKLTSLIIGSLYLSIRSRKENIELSLITAAQVQGYSIPGKEIIKAASLIRQHAKIRVSHVKSEEYLENIISRLQRDKEILKRVKKKINNKTEYFNILKIGAKKLLMNFPLSERGGRNPFILAASIIIAADIMLARKLIFPHCYVRRSRRGILTQKYIAKILNIAEFTLREHYLLLAKPLIDAELSP